MQKKVMIIGGGMAGLSAGAYLQMNGYQAEIFEMQHVPGGVCTSWQRGEYTVDLCIHWLVGSGDNHSFYGLWNELVDMERISFVNHDEYFRIEGQEGACIRLFTNVDRLQEELLEKAPEDREEILRFTGAIRRLSHLDVPMDKAPELSNLWDRMKMYWKVLPYLGIFGKFMHLSNAEYSKKFKNPLLRRAIYNLFEPEMTVIFSMMTLSWMHNQVAGYPIGGSMRFARQLAQRFTSLGGRIHYESRVRRILVESGRAIGIELADGRQYRGDYVISAADGFSTIHELLDGQYTNAGLSKAFGSRPTFPGLVFGAFGVGRRFDKEPHALLFPLCAPILIDPETTIGHLSLRIHNFDPTLAPEGKTLLTTMIETYNFGYWQRLYQERPGQYRAEKERLADTLIHALEHRFGDIADKVEMTDIATPATFYQYTHNWKGSFEGWLATPDIAMRQFSQQLDGLSHFYLCGHWVAPGGGLPTVMLSGRNAAQLICHQDKRPFIVVPPAHRKSGALEAVAH